MRNVTVYTDGALRRYKTFIVGAWAFYMYNTDAGFSHAEIEEYQGITNNQMETKAVTQAVLAAPDHAMIDLYTDSQYVVLGINRNFVSKTNKSYWHDLKQALTIKHSQIKVHHVMGHQDNVGNNIADLSMRAMLDELVAKRKSLKK